MRLQWQAVAAGVAVAVIGATGLVRGLTPDSSAGGAQSAQAAGASSRISVSGVYVRAPVPPTKIAAAYFTVYNTTDKADRLISIETGAGATAVLHKVNPDGTMSASPSGAVIPAHGSLVLTTGKNHVMIENLFGQLVAGQTVNVELDFRNAGPVNLVAPVIAPGAPAPAADPKPSGVH